MDNIKCSTCGKAGDKEKDWMKCSDCGYVVCPHCGHKEREEQVKLDKLRSGDAHDRISILCPSCVHKMTPFF